MPKKIANTKKISHEEWLAIRKRSIGGSDSGAVVGMNQYISRISLYAEKKGMSKDIESNEAMRIGNDLEDYVAQRYMEATGKKVRNDNFMYADDEYDFMTANVDRVIVGENAGLECKTMGSFGKYDIANGDIPAHYYCQCQHYMAVMGFDYMDIAILVLQKGLYVHRINRDEEFIRDLREAEIDFWTNYVDKDVIPEPDGSESSLETVKLLYDHPASENDVYIPGVDDLIEQYKEMADMEKHYKDRKTEIQTQICAKLGVGGVGYGMAYGCSWKTQSRTNFDAKRLKDEMPEVYARYASVSEYPVFRTKKLKGAK